MKRTLFIFTMLSLFTTAAQAQDDMYFGSSKKAIDKEVSDYGLPRNTYYSGSSRSVDEYNRRGGSSYEYIGTDSAVNDVIDFSGVAGIYPDSTADFNFTRKMSRWDGYTPTDAYWQGYDQGRSDEWAVSNWHSPWYYSSYYYPWYDSWYDPWYYDRWYWRDPWYYRHYSYGWGYYGRGYYGGYYSYHYPRHYYSSGWVAPRSRGMVAAGSKGHSINRGNVVYNRYGTGRSTSGRSVSGTSSRSGISYGNARSSSPRTSSYGSARRSSSPSLGSSSSSRSSYGGGGTSFGSSRSSGGGGGFSGSRGGGGGRSGGRR